MPPPSDAIIIVFDVGRSKFGKNTFFEQSRSCISRIIQRKLISQSKDSLCLILTGSEDSNSDSNTAISGYENIVCQFDFQLASWDMLEFIEEKVQMTDISSDCIGALIVSVEMLKIFEESNNVQNKKIVFFSEFDSPCSDDLDVIAENCKASDIEITIIGHDHNSLLLENENVLAEKPLHKKRRVESDERLEGEKLLEKLWKKLPDHIVICTFELALKQLCSYSRKTFRSTPWNCTLDIGDVKINISMLKKTDPKTSNKFDTKFFKQNENEPPEIVSTVQDKAMVYKHHMGEGKEIIDLEVTKEDIIEGYRYGTTVIPFSVEDKAVLEYKPGPKSFSVIGFTNISSVPYYLLSGECSYIVIPRDKDQNAEVAFSALTQAMKKLDCLGIVRKVYSDNRGLSLGILYPIIEEIVGDEINDEVMLKECLLFVELAFEEEIKSINFPSLEYLMKKMTKNQLDSIDRLIDGMDLMKSDKGINGEPCEAFNPSSLHNVKEQFFQYCVIQRGLHPENPLPTSLPSFVEDFIKLPKSIEESSKSLVKEIIENFKIEVKKEKWPSEKPEKFLKAVDDEIPSSSLAHPDKDNKKKKGTEHFSESSLKEESNPDKRNLLKVFKTFPTNSEIEALLENITEDEVNKSEFVKNFKEVLGRVRHIYLSCNPDKFNWWINDFKTYSIENQGIVAEIWDAVISDKLGLITEKENNLSRISEKEAEDFLKSKTLKYQSVNLSKINKPDVDFFPEAVNDLKMEQMEIDSLF